MPARRFNAGAFLATVFAVAVASSALSACGDDDNGRPASGEGLSGTLTVFAAASLTDAFGALSDMFEKQHRGVRVEVNLASSSSLAGSILEGAPSDVFASADEANMRKVVDAADGLVRPSLFARNLLEIAVPKGNPAGVTGLAGFADPDLLIGLCADGVPCGSLARQALANAGVTPALDTNEPDVRALLTKIEAGELDAGVVYATDVAAAAGRVGGVAIPRVHNVVATYWIVGLARGGDAGLAAAFVALVMSDDGQAILNEQGFLGP